MNNLEKAREFGFFIRTNVLNGGKRNSLMRKFKRTLDLRTGPRGPRSGAIRHAFEAVPAAHEIACSVAMTELAAEVLGGNPLPVRGILFDQSTNANWALPWHQDVCIAVRRRAEVPGFGPWSVKQGVPHVAAPLSVLEGIVTVRVQLDPCENGDGALRVLPGSHKLGKLEDRRIDEIMAQQAANAVICGVSPGDAVVMRPLLLHSSGEVHSARHRRVLHVEYAAADLPSSLEWRWPRAMAASLRLSSGARRPR